MSDWFKVILIFLTFLSDPLLLNGGVHSDCWQQLRETCCSLTQISKAYFQIWVLKPTVCWWGPALRFHWLLLEDAPPRLWLPPSEPLLTAAPLRLCLVEWGSGVQTSLHDGGFIQLSFLQTGWSVHIYFLLDLWPLAPWALHLSAAVLLLPPLFCLAVFLTEMMFHSGSLSFHHKRRWSP